MKKYLLSFSLVFALAIVSVFAVFLSNPTTIYAKTADDVVSVGGSLSGGGTQANPYKISSFDDLNTFSLLVNESTTFKDKYVVLTNNITFPQNKNIAPIGYSAEHRFMGHFDGQGYTIKNLRVGTIFGNTGMFGYISAKDNVTIKNLIIENLTISGSPLSGNVDANVGAVVGYCELGNSTDSVGTLNHHSLTISEVAVKSGTINVSSAKNCFAGGIVGATTLAATPALSSSNPFTDTLHIYLSWSRVNITCSALNSGWSVEKSGILGIGFATIENCYTIGNPILNLVHPSGVSGLFLIRFCYDKIDANIASYNYYSANAYNDNFDGIAYDLPTLKTKMQNGFNEDEFRFRWIIIEDNEGEWLVLSNVGYQVTSADIQVQYRAINIPASSSSLVFNNISTDTKTLKIGETFTAPQQTNCTQNNLSKLGVSYMSFSNGVNIDTPSITITSTHIDYALIGATLVVNYISNAKLITINGIECWIVPDNNNLYTFANNKFTQVNIDNIIPADNNGKYFLGWSTTKVDQVCEIANKQIDGVYKDWYTDGATFVVRVIRGNMESSNGTDTTKTSIDFNESLYNSLSSSTNFYEVWGDFSLRMYTSVYLKYNDTYHRTTNVQIITNASKTIGGYKIANGTSYALTLKNSKGVEITVGENLGYTSVEWFIGEIKNNAKDLTNYTSTNNGTLSSNNTLQTNFTSTTKETSIVAVLVPKTDIGLTVNVAEFDGIEKTELNLLNENFTTPQVLTNGTKIDSLVYGETYTIKIDDLAYGWYIKSIKSNPNIKITKNLDSCTFTVNFINDITVNLDVDESILSNVVKYAFIALLITAGATILLTLIINTFKPEKTEIVVNKEPKKK